MTPEEKFNQDVWWILQEIKKEQLVTLKGKKVEFIIRQPDKSGIIPSAERQRKLLYKLQERGILKVEIDVFYGFEFNLPKKYLLSINQQKFDGFYKKWEEIDENPWLSEETKITQRKKLFERQRKEAETRADKIRRQFEELGEKQKEREVLKKEIIEETKKSELKTSDKWLVFHTKDNVELKFKKENGDVKFGKAEGNLAPNTGEYKVFLHLLEASSHMAKYTDLLKEIYPQKEIKEPLKDHQPERWALDTVIRNIKTGLGILPKEKSLNKDIFKPLKKWKGYRLMLVD